MSRGRQRQVGESGEHQHQAAVEQCATVAPPSTLPSRIVQRGSGETSTSRRKPNWRSQITDTADCTDVYMMLSAITAGKMNCR